MRAHDLAHRRQAQPVAGRACREERLEDAPQRRLVHTAAAVAHGDAHIMAFHELAMAQQCGLRDLAQIHGDLDTSGIVHRLGSVGGEIEDHLLQLRKLPRDDGILAAGAHRELHLRGQRRPQQRGGLRDQSLHVHRTAASVPASAEGEDLIDQVAGALPGPPDRIEVAQRPAVRGKLCFHDLRMTKDRADDVVEVVSDAARKRAHGLHAAGLLQPRLETSPLALERVAPDGVGDGVDRHAQQAELAGTRGELPPDRIEAQDRADAVGANARHTQPAADVGDVERLAVRAGRQAIDARDVHGPVSGPTEPAHQP